MVSQEWFFHWDNTPVHTLPWRRRGLQPPGPGHGAPHHSPDLALADYFLFQSVKEELAGIWVTPESLKRFRRRRLKHWC
jgi:hypothetical protein